MTSFSCIGNFAHTLGRLQNWQPVLGNSGPIGATGSSSGKTLEGIGMPMNPERTQRYSLP